MLIKNKELQNSLLAHFAGLLFFLLIFIHSEKKKNIAMKCKYIKGNF